MLLVSAVILTMCVFRRLPGSLFPAVVAGLLAGKSSVKDEKEHASAGEKSVEKILFMVKAGESIVC